MISVLVDADPVVGETEMRTGLNLRHVAADTAGDAVHGAWMRGGALRRAMTGEAGLLRAAGDAEVVVVRVVAGDAAQAARALAIAATAGQAHRGEADQLGRVGREAGRRLGAVALAAEWCATSLIPPG